MRMIIVLSVLIAALVSTAHAEEREIRFSCNEGRSIHLVTWDDSYEDIYVENYDASSEYQCGGKFIKLYENYVETFKMTSRDDSEYLDVVRNDENTIVAKGSEKGTNDFETWFKVSYKYKVRLDFNPENSNIIDKITATSKEYHFRIKTSEETKVFSNFIKVE